MALRRPYVFNETTKLWMPLSASDSLDVQNVDTTGAMVIGASATSTTIGAAGKTTTIAGNLQVAGTSNIGGTVGPGTTGKLAKFTGTNAIGDSIVADNGTKVSIAGALGSTGQFAEFDGTYGWKDKECQIVPPNSGASIPTLTAMGASNMRGWAWQVDDQSWGWIHCPHDYVEGTQIAIHMHWTTSGTQTGVVRWRFEWWHAKGHNQANFGFGGAGTVITCEQAAAGSAWRHMITETSLFTVSGLEPDSHMAFYTQRVTNGGTDVTDVVFGTQFDLHYQARIGVTKNRTPNFYT